MFGNINADIIKEALAKDSVYNNIIAKYVEEINLKYSMEWSFTQLEATEVSHWVETLEVAASGKDHPNQQQPQQPPNLQQPQEAQQTQDTQQALQP